MKFGMSIYKQQDIVLVPFPFSDLSNRKVRPVLVLSNNAYNRQSLDILVCGLTTNLRPDSYSIIIATTDTEIPGTLRHRSKIRVATMVSLEQSIFIKRIARLKPSVFERVVAVVQDLIKPL